LSFKNEVSREKAQKPQKDEEERGEEIWPQEAQKETNREGREVS
jgi:hypothetical protein